MKKIKQHWFLIIDLDGTLYNRRLLLLRALARILIKIIRREFSIKIPIELVKLKMKLKFYVSSLPSREAAIKARRELDQMTYRTWITEIVCPILNEIKDTQVVKRINEMNSSGHMVCVYSDFPTDEKLAALGFSESIIRNSIHSTSPEIMEFKPSTKGLDVITRSHIMERNVICMGDSTVNDKQPADHMAFPFRRITYRLLSKKSNLMDELNKIE